MSFELIQATEADKEFLLTLRKLTMVEHLEQAGLHLSDEEHAFRLNDDYECSYLIVCCGEKVGTLKYRELADKIEIMQLQVHPESQGKGLGKQVMERVLGWSKRRHKGIELTVLKANPARILYERLGFSISGENEHEFHMEYIQ
jgi:GNAT superfamily N-acetyltransferase